MSRELTHIEIDAALLAYSRADLAWADAMVKPAEPRHRFAIRAALAAQGGCQDAARWRFARDHWHDLCTATGAVGDGFGVIEIFIGVGEHEPYAHGSVDAAIDAAMTVPILTECAPQTSAGLASKEAGIVKLSEGQVGDAGEAIRLAALFERLAIDHEPYGWPAIQQHRLSHAAALLRAHAATVAELRERLGECYVLAGADTDGDPPARHANDAVRAVRELRADYDEACEELHGTNGWKPRAEAAIAVLRDIDAHGYMTDGDYEMVRDVLAGAAAEGGA